MISRINCINVTFLHIQFETGLFYARSSTRARSTTAILPPSAIDSDAELEEGTEDDDIADPDVVHSSSEDECISPEHTLTTPSAKRHKGMKIIWQVYSF